MKSSDRSICAGCGRGELVTNTWGMLPEASLVFLDELLNANSAILNSLLLALNERIFRRGKESRRMKALMFVGASNHLPEDDALKALFDRFLLRVRADNVAPEQLPAVLDAGWKLQRTDLPHAATLHFEDIEALQRLLPLVDLSAVRGRYAELVQRIRHTGLALSDRRAVKLQRLIAASALLCARMEARLSDLWILKHIWDTEEQREVLHSLVGGVVNHEAGAGGDHPRARTGEEADAEQSGARSGGHRGAMVESGCHGSRLPAGSTGHPRQPVPVGDGSAEAGISDQKCRRLVGAVRTLMQ